MNEKTYKVDISISGSMILNIAIVLGWGRSLPHLEVPLKVCGGGVGGSDQYSLSLFAQLSLVELN